jgi:putative hydrolase of the HAD superfamily
MKATTPVTSLFVDIGGILLTNGWDHLARKRAASNFNLDRDEMESRHGLNSATYEEGKLTLEEYLNRTVFHEDRSFTRDQFQEFMYAQSQPYPEMIDLVRSLKLKYGLKIVVVSNEGRELNDYRIDKFKLGSFIDIFISSCYVHLRKPDVDIFKLAIDIAQVSTQQVIFIENTLMFAQIAEELGIRSILHTDYHSTREQLALYGLQFDEGIANESH